MDEKKIEEAPKIDSRTEAFRLARTHRGWSWRQVRIELNRMGVKDPEAKQSAKGAYTKGKKS